MVLDGVRLPARATVAGAVCGATTSVVACDIEMDRKAILLLSTLSVDHRAYDLDLNALYAVREG